MSGVHEEDKGKVNENENENQDADGDDNDDGDDDEKYERPPKAMNVVAPTVCRRTSNIGEDVIAGLPFPTFYCLLSLSLWINGGREGRYGL